MMARTLPLGPVWADVRTTALTQEDRELLLHPAVGGVILFGRNCESADQVKELVQAIQAVRTPPLLVGIDQEGGRVQRLKEGVSILPAMGAFGQIWDCDGEMPARQEAQRIGRRLADEMRALGIHLSFAPVLDLNRGVSTVIGDRAFHAEPTIVAELASAFWNGMQSGGLAGVGKHFPGHGGAELDSHLALPTDSRPFEEIHLEDGLPFQRLIADGIFGIMPAHVQFSNATAHKERERPASFSPFWLRTILRDRLNFKGLVFSDDLTMEGAAMFGSIADRVCESLVSGCDFALVCNHPEEAYESCEMAIKEKMPFPSPEKITQLLSTHP